MYITSTLDTHYPYDRIANMAVFSVYSSSFNRCRMPWGLLQRLLSSSQKSWRKQPSSVMNWSRQMILEKHCSWMSSLLWVLTYTISKLSGLQLPTSHKQHQQMEHGFSMVVAWHDCSMVVDAKIFLAYKFLNNCSYLFGKLIRLGFSRWENANCILFLYVERTIPSLIKISPYEYVKAYTLLQYLNQFIEDMPSEVFDQFLLHLSQCALSYKSQAEHEQRKGTLSQLFVSCDHTGVRLRKTTL